jgi:hypothetical protein
MKYFKTDCDKLIQFNPETNVYRHRNVIKGNQVIDVDTFNSFVSTQIKKDEFSRLMNAYFKYVKHEWEFEGKTFKKIDNFEADDRSIIKNYILGKDIPWHNISKSESYKENVILVYHWGKVYYFTVSYNGYKQGQLIDPRTMNYVRWAQAKHCAPVFCKDTKQIC